MNRWRCLSPEYPDKLSLVKDQEKQLYQLIISRLNGDWIGDREYRREIRELVAKGISGFIIFGGTREEITFFIHELQSLAELPLFISSDIERGVGQQIKGCTTFPCPMATAAAVRRDNPDDRELLREMVAALSAEALTVGIQLPFLPVLDVNSNPDNPIICTRAFSDRPEKVAWFGARYIEILEAWGLLSCGKHFPGHGDTDVDSHLVLPRLPKSRAELMACELPPFAAAVQAGASCIMAGHLLLPALDSLPASLSSNILSGLLRDELGFQGLIITDALNMDALRAMGNVPCLALAAGADILLHPSDPQETVKELKTGLSQGIVNEEKAEEALTRISRAKSRISKEGRTIALDYEKNRKLSEEITRRSITLVKGQPGIFPLADHERATFFLAGDRQLYHASLISSRFKAMPVTGERPFPGGKAVFCLFTSASAWKGTSDIDKEQIGLIKKLMRRADESVIISFGSPYSLRHFPEAEFLIAAYEATEQAQEAAVEALREGRFVGRLPVRVFHGRD